MISQWFVGAVAIIISIKQGCPLSSTLFGLYIDEVSHLSRESWCFRRMLRGNTKTPNVLNSFCIDKGLLVNLDETKVMVFNTSQTWV